MLDDNVGVIVTLKPLSVIVVLANDAEVTVPVTCDAVVAKLADTAFKQGFELFLELSKTLGLDPKSRLTLEYFQDGSGDEEDEIAKLLKMN